MLGVDVSVNPTTTVRWRGGKYKVFNQSAISPRQTDIRSRSETSHHSPPAATRQRTPQPTNKNSPTEVDLKAEDQYQLTLTDA